MLEQIKINDWNDIKNKFTLVKNLNSNTQLVQDLEGNK